MKNVMKIVVGLALALSACGPTNEPDCKSSGGTWRCETTDGVQDCECEIFTELPDTASSS